MVYLLLFTNWFWSLTFKVWSLLLQCSGSDESFSGRKCKGYCELSAWFIQVLFAAFIMILFVVIACVRLATSPLRKFLLNRGCISSEEKMPPGGVSRSPSSKTPNFEDVVLIRSLSEHHKWISVICNTYFVYHMQNKVRTVVKVYVLDC